MFRSKWGYLAPIIGMFLAGCAQATPVFEDPEPRPLGRDLPGVTAPRPEPDTTPVEFSAPAGDLSLREALSAALTNNPRLAVYSWEMRAKEAESIQAGLLPNPHFAAEIENFAGGGEYGGFGGAETTLLLSQLIQLGGKRGKRVTVAKIERGLAAWDYEMARIEVLTGTVKAFIEVLAAQQQLAVAEEVVLVAEGILNSVSRRVKAGATSPVEENRARVELETTRIDRQQTYRDLMAARQRLAAAWGSAEPGFTKTVGELEKIPTPPSLETLKNRVEQNPSLARWITEMQLRHARVDLERSEGVLDLTVGAGARYFSQSNDAAFVVQMGLPLQLFDRNQGTIDAATIRVERGRQELRAEEIRVETLLTISHETLLAAALEVTALRDRALPEAETAFEAAQKAYLRGSMRFTDVLDTQRLFFELKSRYFTALARYHSTIAEIEKLTGVPIALAPETTGRP